MRPARDASATIWAPSWAPLNYGWNVECDFTARIDTAVGAGSDRRDGLVLSPLVESAQDLKGTQAHGLSCTHVHGVAQGAQATSVQPRGKPIMSSTNAGFGPAAATERCPRVSSVSRPRNSMTASVSVVPPCPTHV